MCAFLDTCVELSRLFEACCHPLPNFRSNGPWQSLKVFLRSYAFERQGRAPDYVVAAADTIDHLSSGHLNADSARRVWESFSQRLGNQKLNCANNPLCPQGTTYDRSNKGRQERATITQLSVVELVVNKLNTGCIIEWTRQKIKQNKVKEAHGTLRRINGIGNKIASLFMRDVATSNKLQPADDRQLLQPVDVWIREVARQLANDSELTDSECAEYFVDHSNEPERANQGAWYFCTQIAKSSSYGLRCCLTDQKRVKALVAEHLDSLISSARIAENLQREWGIVI